MAEQKIARESVYVLEAAEVAKKNHGRLRLVVDRNMSTTDLMVGCVQLGDWRSDAQ